MSKYKIAKPTELVDKAIYGGKAFWLSWLIINRYNVPECFFIPAVDERELKKLMAHLTANEDFQEELMRFHNEEGLYAVAVRSSAIKEDQYSESYAGHFKSFIQEFQYDELLTGIGNVVKSNCIINGEASQKVGVVVQRKIDASFSGIAFSSDPITGSKKAILISIIEGMGENLASGKKSGEDVIIEEDSNQYIIPSYDIRIGKEYLLTLSHILKDIENKVNAPVDIEWCIDKSTNELFILQCRPITTIFPKHTGVIPISLRNENTIPEQVKESDKVKIRLIAQRNNIDISNAYLVVFDPSGGFDENLLLSIKPQVRCKGFSVVLIYPKTISGNIIRHFAENEFDRQNSAFRTCQRYDVRSYQDYSSLKRALFEIRAKCFEETWTCIAIIQEIFEPELTGIAKKIEDGYLVEVAKGHFVPKGLVPTSQYLVSFKGEIQFKNEVMQDFEYKIIQGTVSKAPVNSVISATDNTITNVIQDLMPILSTSTQAIEFGLLKDEKGLLNPYLIDLVDDNNVKELNSRLITQGVISIGKRTGRIKILSDNDIGNNSLELHYHNVFQNDTVINEDTIFVADTPDIALLEVLRHYNDDRIGFIFRTGSALSHFSIILREKKIPAVVINKNLNVYNMEEVTIDAISPNLEAHKRVVKQSGCVTTYINPDADGICSSLAYEEYAKKLHKKSYLPVYFGKLDNETKFILEYLKVAPPSQITNCEVFNEFVLVDTHHVAQLPKEIPLDKVVEILDHHPGGDNVCFPNAKIQNDEVGAVCTIITERFKDAKVFPDGKTAALLSFGIISNTLNFTAPSTSPRDHEAYMWLTSISGPSKDVIKQLFEARSDIANVPSQDIIRNNLKQFEWSNKKVGISQVEMTDIDSLIKREDFLVAMLDTKEELALDFVIFSGINLLDHTTTIFCPDIETLHIIKEGMSLPESSNPLKINRILMRKTDFIPQLKRYFELSD